LASNLDLTRPSPTILSSTLVTVLVSVTLEILWVAWLLRRLLQD
jgi:hypothetical protein